MRQLSILICTLFVGLLLGQTIVKAQQLISYELIASYDKEGMETVLFDFLGGIGDDLPLSEDQIIEMMNITHPVDVYRVLYNTEHPILGTIQASGAFSMPTTLDCALPVAVYQHGTTFNRTGVPSFLSIEHNIGAILSSSGYASVLPDYMGLGDSEGMHPYVHAGTQAQAGVDMLRAVREMQEQLNYELRNELFICGYSQGGHASMALFKEIETNLADEFFVAGASPMSGPYAVFDVQEQVMWQDYSSPAYLPYLLIGYQSIYPQLADYSNIWKPEFDHFNNFTGDSDDFFEILNLVEIPDNPSTMIKQEFIDEYDADDNHPLKVVLRENENHDWVPSAPVLLSGCCDDEQVLYENAIVAEETFNENGAADVARIDFCTLFGNTGFLGHNGCVPYCLLWTKNFFDDIAADCGVSTEALGSPSVFTYPNPATEQVTVILPIDFGSKYSVTLTDVAGRMVLSQDCEAIPQIELDVRKLSTGTYVLQVVSEGSSYDYGSTEQRVYQEKLLIK